MSAVQRATVSSSSEHYLRNLRSGASTTCPSLAAHIVSVNDPGKQYWLERDIPLLSRLKPTEG